MIRRWIFDKSATSLRFRHRLVIQPLPISYPSFFNQRAKRKFITEFRKAPTQVSGPAKPDLRERWLLII